MKELTLDNLKFAIDQVCQIYGEKEMIVVGSMSILGSDANPPGKLKISEDIDLYPKSVPSEKTLEVALEYGIESDFREENGWYVEAVGDWTTMTTPHGWKERLVPVVTENGSIGWCLSPIDLAFNKVEAGRPKDIENVALLIHHGYVVKEELETQISLFPEEPEIRAKNQRVFSTILEHLATLPPKSPTTLPEVPHVPPNSALAKKQDELRKTGSLPPQEPPPGDDTPNI